jgi:ABC-type phosphate transport system substrate-binding protein
MNKVIRFLKQIKSNSKIIAISFFGVVGISTIILTSVNFTGISIITAAGSSSIFPLMNAMANLYSAIEPSTEIMVESGGSGAGLTAASRLSKDIGNVTGTVTTKKVGAPEIGILGSPNYQPAIEQGS